MFNETMDSSFLRKRDRSKFLDNFNDDLCTFLSLIKKKKLKLDGTIFGAPEAYENVRKKVHTIKPKPEDAEKQSSYHEERVNLSKLVSTEYNMECRPGEFVC